MSIRIHGTIAAGAVAIAALLIATAPVASAEDGAIAFTGLKRNHKSEQNIYGVYVKHANGNVSRRLLANPGEVDISADGKWIVAAARGPRQYDLFLISTKDGRVRKLTDTRQRSESSPSFSPNARRIAFHADAKKGKSGLAVMPRSGGRGRVIKEGGRPYDPDWGPNGEQIVFIRGGKVTVIRPDGHGMRSFRNHLPGSDYTPSLSPDGGSIVFKHYAEGGVSDLYVFEIATKEVRPLFIGEGASYNPSYSPDGERVLFARVPGRKGSRFTERLYTIDADDGSGLERVDGLGAFSVIEDASWAGAG